MYFIFKWFSSIEIALLETTVVSCHPWWIEIYSTKKVTHIFLDILGQYLNNDTLKKWCCNCRGVWNFHCYSSMHCKIWPQIDGLMQEICNSIANALELHLSCTNPSKYLWCILGNFFSIVFASWEGTLALLQTCPNLLVPWPKDIFHLLPDVGSCIGLPHLWLPW